SKDATVVLKQPRKITLESALEYVESDELVEITPAAIRMRKRLLSENDRKRADRAEKSRAAALG
ncbi:MAG: GTP-binding protein TypA/BipA, partial [Planctomycetota bacterium]